MGDFIKNAPELMGAIALMGGAGGAMATHQQSKNTSAQAQADAAADGQAQGETQDQPSPSAAIPDNTTNGDQNATDSGQQSPAADSNGQPSQPTPSAAAKPSRPPLDVETSKKLIANVEKIAEHRPLNPVEKADLDQARQVVAEDEARKAQPSGPPPSVETSLARIHNIMNRPPEARQHPTTQADLAQAQQVVQEQVQKLENQQEPLSNAQKQELADAKATLARLGPERSTSQGESGPPPQGNAGGSRLQFSQGGTESKPTADSDIVDAHRTLSQEEDAFQLGKSKPDTSKMSTDDALKELAKSYSQEGMAIKVSREGPSDRSFRIETPNGEAVVTLDHANKTMRINSANLDSNTTKRGGGANVYQMAATFAQQHGYTFLPDKTVQPVAQNRRISQMISSVLRHGGSTKHFDGEATFQGAQTGDQIIANDKPVTKAELPGWKAGNDEHNLALMLRREHADVMTEAKARGIDLSHLTYDPDSRSIINGHTGTPLTEGALKSLVDRFEPGDSGVGQTTLLRALVTGSTLQGHTADGGVQPLRENAGGNPGGVGTGTSDSDLVSLARHLYYSRPSGGAGGVSPRRMGDALSERPDGIATAVAQVSDHLKTQVPGLLHDNTQVYHSAEDFLNSDYAKKHPLSKEDLDKLHSAEGFFDPKTGHSAIIAGNVELRAGETPHDALTRVILHERVGHDGLQTLLGSKDSQAQKHWEGLTQRIRPEELDAIARQEGYTHLAGDSNALAHEWFARQAEKSPHLLRKPGLLRDMWEAFKAQLRKMSNHWKNTDESLLDTHLQELLRHSRKAALRQRV